MKFINDSGLNYLIQKIDKIKHFWNNEERSNYKDSSNFESLDVLFKSNDAKPAKNNTIIARSLMVGKGDYPLLDVRNDSIKLFRHSNSAPFITMANDVMQIHNFTSQIRFNGELGNPGGYTYKGGIYFWLNDENNENKKGSKTYIDKNNIWTNKGHFQRIYGATTSEIADSSENQSLQLRYINSITQNNVTKSIGPTIKLGYRNYSTGSFSNNYGSGSIFMTPNNADEPDNSTVGFHMREDIQRIQLWANGNSNCQSHIYICGDNTGSYYDNHISIYGGDWLNLEGNNIDIGEDSAQRIIIGNYSKDNGIYINNDGEWLSIKSNTLNIYSTGINSVLYLNAVGGKISIGDDANYVEINATLEMRTGRYIRTNNLYLKNKIRQGYTNTAINNWIDEGLLSNLYDIKTNMDYVENNTQSSITVEGNFIHIEDAAPINAEDCKVTLTPKQEGTGDPSPTNVRPITGYTECNIVRCGKNLVDQTEFVQGTISGITGEDIPVDTRLRSPFISVMQNQYSFSCNSGVVLHEIDYYDSNKTWLGYLSLSGMLTYTYNRANNVAFIKILIRKPDNSVITVSDLAAFMFNAGSTALPYEPYTGQPIRIQFGQTVYSATVKPLEGKVVVDKGYDYITSVSSVFEGETSSFKYFDIFDKTYDVSPWETNIICNEFCMQGTYPYVQMTGNKYLRVCYELPSDMTRETFKTFVQNNPIQIVYPLATPIEISVTPQQIALLENYNNLWTDNGTLNLTYQPNNMVGELKGQIQDLQEQINTLINQLNNLSN